MESESASRLSTDCEKTAPFLTTQIHKMTDPTSESILVVTLLVCLSHATLILDYQYFEAFLALIVTNLNQKFNTQILKNITRLYCMLENGKNLVEMFE
jgi:hypothetical protein